MIGSQTQAFDGFGNSSAAVAPTEGSYLAFVSNQTSAGNRTLTGSSLLRTITIPANAVSLQLDLRVLNNDLSDDFAIYDDFAGIALTEGVSVLNQYNIDLNPASAANAHITAGAAAGGFLNSTAWLHPTFKLAGLGGKTLTFHAYSLNYGADNSRETRLLLDNIRIETGAIPEPGTFAVGVLIAGFCGVYRFPRRERTPVA